MILLPSKIVTFIKTSLSGCDDGLSLVRDEAQER